MPQAKWLVNIDWNNDGDFSDSNEDVTSDVIGLTLEHFRDLASGHVEAAQLELQLSPNPPKDTDGRREDSGRGWVRELQGRWPGVLG